MPTKDEPDRLQREIEDLLGQLDNFVPEERLATKIRGRRKQKAVTERAERGPSIFDRAFARFGRITLGQLMIGGLALLAIAFLFGGPLGSWARWVMVAGMLLTGVAFVLSIVQGRGAQSTLGGRVQRRWRGQIIEYGEPSRTDRVRGWFRRRGRR